ncbi:hypothetical protein C2S52_002400 [Perilla frutescens var. hirtella]|nr:hypothetical protein C2S52_002400 [Perilla frutescens var. hirtella]
MMSHAPYLFLLLLNFLRTSTTVSAATPPAYTATDLILLSCGESENSKDNSNRSWVGDVRSRYVPSFAANISLEHKSNYVFPVPCRSVRVIRSPFTYTFPVRPGQKFLRLYFNVYSGGVDTYETLFSVTANAFTLFSNFSASLYSENTPHMEPYFTKEFVVSVGENQTLDLTFSPNENSSAFINGIEIVSMPDNLYFRGTAIKSANGVFDLRNDTALENLYRLDVGGRRSVDIQDDSGPNSGMFRAWSLDDDYIVGSVDTGYSTDPANIQLNYTVQTPPYSAPAMVYTSARVMRDTDVGLEWIFPVDSGFYYLLRLHFCEFTLDVRARNQRVFTVNINYEMLEVQADVISWAGGPDLPIFRDYITSVPDDGRRGRKRLRLSLFPYLEGNPKYYSALLNGLEIFKLSDSNRSLAAANPLREEVSLPPALPRIDDTGIPPRKNRSRRSSLIYAVPGSVISVLAVVAAVSFMILRQRPRVKESAAMSVTKTSWISLSTASRSTATPCGSGVSLPSDLCRYFTIAEIKTATRNFDSNFIIGKGGFGNVYKGLVDKGAITVAIKRLHHSSNQGAREFLTEIEMLSTLRHLHLVPLIGYCDDGGEMILVYDYMANGTLCDHLYNSGNPPLTWKQRLQICMGAAKGLHYLHNGAEHTVIHRDVKSTNILLDEAWEAKISDFGLSKMGKSNDSFTHISTNVKGTFGYLDPKYLLTHQLTRKSDVYAFGVVLCEVLSGRAAVDVRLDEEQHSLAGWARYCIREGQADRLIDPNLMGQISEACFKVFVGIAGRCIHTKSLERPTMADVVMGLELALALQQTTDSTEQVEDDDDAGRTYRDGINSMEDITAPKEGSDEFIRVDNPSSSASSVILNSEFLEIKM